MNRKIFLLLVTGIGCLLSCGRNNNPAPQSPIVGTWNLQQQHVVMVEDSVKITDTVFTASAKTDGSAQFNQDGTFSSSSLYTPANYLSLNGPVPTWAKSAGTYTYTATKFTMSPGVSGWFTFVTGSSTTPTGVSQSALVTQLNTANLTIHTTNTFTVTTGMGLHTFSESLDFYYSK